MTITATTNLSLPIITTGTESGTWGDVVDNGLTAYLDIAIAGGLAVPITTTDVTLANTAGTSAATGIVSTTAQYAILNISGAKTAARNLNLPVTSKSYIINNAGTGGFALTVRGVTPTTGVTLVDGEKAIIAWSAAATDYVKITSSVVSNLTGTLAATNGGTGQSSYAIGDVLYASTTTALSKLADVATGNALISGGVGVAPSYGKIGLTTHVSGTLPIANGGTNSTATATNGGVGYGTGTAHAYSAAGTSGQVLISAGAAAPTWSSGTGTGSVVRAISPTITGNDTTIEGLVVGLGNGAVYNNTAYGVAALNANATGAQNTAVGYGALQLNTNDQNTAVGNLALYANVGGYSNTAVGTTALTNNTSGNNNTAVGNVAGQSNTTGIYNTAVGASALASNTIGNSNTAVGFGAIYSGNGGTSNTAIGYSAGTTVYGDYNTFIGYQSGSGVTSGGKNVIIGSYQGAIAPISGTGSNWIVLSDADTNIRQVIDPSGNATFGTGAVVVYAPAPASITTTATLTNANLQAQIISTTGTSYTVTMPLGSTMDTLVTWYKVDVGYDFSVINTASGTITMAVNTGVTSLGALTIATGTSAQFRIRRTAASTYVLYRLS